MFRELEEWLIFGSRKRREERAARAKQERRKWLDSLPAFTLSATCTKCGWMSWDITYNSVGRFNDEIMHTEFMSARCSRCGAARYMRCKDDNAQTP